MIELARFYGRGYKVNPARLTLIPTGPDIVKLILATAMIYELTNGIESSMPNIDPGCPINPLVGSKSNWA